MNRRPLITFMIVFALAAGGTAFAFRNDLRDAYARWRRGPVPEAVSREEAIHRAEKDDVGTTNVNAAEPAPAKPEPVSPGPAPEKTPPAPAPAPSPSSAEGRSASGGDLPASYNLKVLFAPQSPYRKWDARDEDACEEASMIMMRTYHDGTKSLTLEEIDQELDKIVEYEMRTLGYFESTDAELTASVLRGIYGLAAKALPVASLDDIKGHIAAGRPVMIPAAGRLLNNPNFKNGGPLYHMLVIKGYTADTFITNDPGTRVGENYVYPQSVIWNAMHDWNDGNVNEGKRMMIVVE